MKGLKDIKKKMAEEYIKTTLTVSEMADKYETSLSTVKRVINKYGNTIKAENKTAEDWKLDPTGYYVSNKGRVKDQENILIKCFKNHAGLMVKLPNGSFYVKDLMFRSFKRPIADNEFITVPADKKYKFGLGDLTIKTKGD